jgi:hypothetical protein
MSVTTTISIIPIASEILAHKAMQMPMPIIIGQYEPRFI